jgi:hypothetical protein
MQFKDLRLNYCIPEENSKNHITGEAVEKGDFGSLGPPQAPLFSLPYLVRLISIRLND